MKAAVASISLLALGCEGGIDPLPQPTVTQVLADCDAYLGKAVRVAGYLGECGGYDCHLFGDRAGMVEWDRYIANLREPGSNRPDVPEPRDVMGVGGEDEAWDRKAASFQRSYVVITGRMDSESCDGRGGLDRSPGIDPTDIRIWTPAEGAPTN